MRLNKYFRCSLYNKHKQQHTKISVWFALCIISTKPRNKCAKQWSDRIP